MAQRKQISDYIRDNFGAKHKIRFMQEVCFCPFRAVSSLIHKHPGDAPG